MCINGAHANDVNSLCITPDCKHLVSASSDGTAKVWELPRCRLAQTVHHHRAIVVTAECFDNNLVASGGCDRAVRLWDLHTGMQHSTMRGHTNNVSLSVLRSRALFLYLSLSASVCLCLPRSLCACVWCLHVSLSVVCLCTPLYALRKRSVRCGCLRLPGFVFYDFYEM